MGGVLLIFKELDRQEGLAAPTAPCPSWALQSGLISGFPRLETGGVSEGPLSGFIG